MKTFKILIICFIIINVIVLSIYQHQFGLKTIMAMLMASAAVALFTYKEAQNIKRGWATGERTLLIRKVTEVSLALLMAFFAGTLLVKIWLYTFIF